MVMVQGGQWIGVTFGFSVVAVVADVVVVVVGEGGKEEVMGKKPVLPREASFSAS